MSAGASYSSVLQEVGVVYTNPVCTKEMSLVAPLQSLTHLPFLSSFSLLCVSLLHCPSPPLAPFISSPLSLPSPFLLPLLSFSPFLLLPPAPPTPMCRSRRGIRTAREVGTCSLKASVDGRGSGLSSATWHSTPLPSTRTGQPRRASLSPAMCWCTLLRCGVCVCGGGCGRGRGHVCVCRHVCLLWWRQLRLVIVGKCH